MFEKTGCQTFCLLWGESVGIHNGLLVFIITLKPDFHVVFPSFLYCTVVVFLSSSYLLFQPQRQPPEKPWEL